MTGAAIGRVRHLDTATLLPFVAPVMGDISAILRAVPTTVGFYPVERRSIYGSIRARF